MKIYLTTDTHFGHDKLMEYCGRPENFEEIILHELNKIPAQATLIHLGDFCIGRDEHWHEQFMLSTAHLKRRLLIRGNHDHKSDSWYLDHGWDWISQFMGGECFGKNILFSHRPMPDDNWYDFNVHGHFHNSDHRSQEPELLAIKNDKQKLLAIEYTNYRPVLLHKFIS